MDRIGAMTVFCKVVEQGNFAGAATRLDMSTSAVSRQVAQLEALLGARLLNRTTRRISLTENGRAYYERCLQLLADLEEAEEQVAGATAELRGTLRLTAPISFGTSHLPLALGEFATRHPGVAFEVALSDHTVDLVEAGLDLAIRVGNVGTQNVVARPIGDARLMVCASAEYLAGHGHPPHPRALLEHECLIYTYASSPEWVFLREGEPEQRVRVAGRLHANNGMLLAEFAAQGLGIALGPDFILQPLVNAGRLQEIMPAWRAPVLNMYAVYPSRRHLSAKVRSFVAFMEQWLTENCVHTRGLKKKARAAK